MEMTKSTKTIYFVIDCSGSMYGARADAVNVAMEKVAREAIPKIKADKGSQIDCRFKFLGFSDGFNGKVVELMAPATLDTFKAWKKIPQTSFRNGTPTGAALQAVIDDLEGAQNGDRDMNAPAAAIILVSDGMPNGSNPTYDEVLLRAEKGRPDSSAEFRRAVKLAIGINVDEEGRKSLKKFGKISKSLAANNVQPYYDCTDDYLAKLQEVLVSLTLAVSSS